MQEHQHAYCSSCQILASSGIAFYPVVPSGCTRCMLLATTIPEPHQDEDPMIVDTVPLTTRINSFWTRLLAPRCLYYRAVVLFCVRSTYASPRNRFHFRICRICVALSPDIPPSLSSSQALEELEEDTGPSYAAQPSTLPQAPSMVPESAGPSGVDEFGLPVAPTPARPAEEVRL